MATCKQRRSNRDHGCKLLCPGVSDEVIEPTFRTSNWHIESVNEEIGLPEIADRELSQ
jgi:hypothetical protein